MKTNRRLAVGLFTLVTISAFEATAVITALPTITDELGGDALYGATLAANLLANIVVIVAAADASDRLGPGRPFLVCASLFVIGLVVAGTANGMLLVVAGRVLQGAGVGGFAAIAYVAVRRAVPAERQPVMYAWLSAGWVLPSLLAPALAGWVTDQFGWRWVFLGIIPLVVVAAAVVAPPLLALAPSPDAAPRDRRRLVDAIRTAIGLAAVLGGLAHSSVVVVVLAVGAGILVAGPAVRHLFPCRRDPGPARLAGDRGLPPLRDDGVPRRRQLPAARRRPDPPGQPDRGGHVDHRCRARAGRWGRWCRHVSTTRWRHIGWCAPASAS